MFHKQDSVGVNCGRCFGHTFEYVTINAQTSDMYDGLHLIRLIRDYTKDPQLSCADEHIHIHQSALIFPFRPLISMYKLSQTNELLFQSINKR